MQSFTQNSIIYESTYSPTWSSTVILYLLSTGSNYPHKRSSFFLHPMSTGIPLGQSSCSHNAQLRAAVAFYAIC